MNEETRKTLERLEAHVAKMDIEGKATLLADVEAFLENSRPPHFVEGGSASISVSYDEGQNWTYLGFGHVGDIRIDAEEDKP